MVAVRQGIIQFFLPLRQLEEEGELVIPVRVRELVDQVVEGLVATR